MAPREWKLSKPVHMKKGKLSIFQTLVFPSSLCPYLHTSLMDYWTPHDLSRPVIQHSDSHTEATALPILPSPLSFESDQDKTLVLSPSDTTTFTSTHSNSWCDSVPQRINKNTCELQVELRVHLDKTMRKLKKLVCGSSNT